MMKMMKMVVKEQMAWMVKMMMMKVEMEVKMSHLQ